MQVILPSRRSLWGVRLFNTGALVLPMAAGVALGYWISDRGVRWLPNVVGVLALVFLAGLVLMVAGAGLLSASDGRPRRKRLIALATLALMTLVVRVAIWAVAQPSPLSLLDPARMGEVFRADAAQYRDLSRALERPVRLLAQESDDAKSGRSPSTCHRRSCLYSS
ncbi:MAG: hypothetical protein HYZ27_03715 [Deltaproteobacteria bacterium]|nr:hypothetical protein [Deltaproteobacteria bacterium]